MRARLASCEFVRQHRSCLIVGQTGVGKSHLAHAVLLADLQQDLLLSRAPATVGVARCLPACLPLP